MKSMFEKFAQDFTVQLRLETTSPSNETRSLPKIESENFQITRQPVIWQEDPGPRHNLSPHQSAPALDSQLRPAAGDAFSCARSCSRSGRRSSHRLDTGEASPLKQAMLRQESQKDKLHF